MFTRLMEDEDDSLRIGQLPRFGCGAHVIAVGGAGQFSLVALVVKWNPVENWARPAPPVPRGDVRVARAVVDYGEQRKDGDGERQEKSHRVEGAQLRKAGVRHSLKRT